jgi:hypothetical protein
MLAQLLIDALSWFDGDIDRVRTFLSRAVALIDGAMVPGDAIGSGRLAVWQARKISALVETNLASSVWITELAASAWLGDDQTER